MEDYTETINEVYDIVESTIPRLVKVLKLLFDELIKQGFSREEALLLTSQFKMTK